MIKEIEVLNEIKSEYLRSREYYNRLAQRQCLEQYQLNKLIEVKQRIKAIKIKAMQIGEEMQMRRPIKTDIWSNTEKIVLCNDGFWREENKLGQLINTHKIKCPYGKSGDIIPLYDEQDNVIAHAEIKVRVERVQDIGYTDSAKEGFFRDVSDVFSLSKKEQFYETWENIYGETEYNWEANSFVWVIEFRRV